MKTRNTSGTLYAETPPPHWELEWRVVAIAAEQCGLDTAMISPTSRLIEDLGIDSLELVELIMALEEAFGVTIPDEAAEEVFTRSPMTLRDMAALVRERWDTGTPARENWRGARLSSPSSEEVPFTQIGGRLDAGEWMDGLLYDEMGPNREGYSQYRRRTDGMWCILIPAGEIWMGNDADGASDQRPAHIAGLSEFLMDSEPVSNAAFSRFLNSVGHVPMPILLDWCGVGEGDKRGHQFALRQGRREWRPLPNTERQPMILVSWYGANAYSLWVHRRDWRFYRGDGKIPTDLKRLAVDAEPPSMAWMYSNLPSEAQWEYVARGGKRSPASPGGTQQVGSTARLACHIVGATYAADTLPAARVSERLGMSLFGLHHMAGNVWQWCRDWYAPDFYQRPEAEGVDPQNAEPTGIRSERGGSWVGPPELAAPWYRRGRLPEARGRCLGFRCVGSTDGLKNRRS